MGHPRVVDAGGIDPIVEEPHHARGDGAVDGGSGPGLDQAEIAQRCLPWGSSGRRGLSTMAGGHEQGQLGDFFEYMERLRNYERSGVPRGASTDSDDGFDLGRMRHLLRRLDDPHNHFPAVHIAGTKGKGSTAAFLSNIMRKQGYNAKCYSSPHLLTIRERIYVGSDGGPVPVGLLSDLFSQAKEAVDESIESENGALTHFEVFTALSFLLFSRENVDIAIVEAGLGGARDATNVIQSTELAASVVTTVRREHLAALGGSLQSIAIAKSGIIKQGRPVFLLELNGGMTSIAPGSFFIAS